MTGQSQGQFIQRNTASIIDNPNQAFTTLFKCNLNRLRTRIQAVFINSLTTDDGRSTTSPAAI